MKTYHCQAKLPNYAYKNIFNNSLKSHNCTSTIYLGNGSYQLTFESKTAIELFIQSSTRRGIFITQFYITEK
ncbi:hypothetical protein ACE193_21355 [Bernardetia sp. OM2101]|uniref:hypothetical protein n=1 Tax=Bernardetia sp. OM2101 TaxID=3344876 RepID=UPI0035D0DB6B